MRPVFRTGYRLKTHFSTTLENTALPINAGGTTIEVLIVNMEITGPIFAGERWKAFADITGRNPAHETAGTFLRTEIWVDPLPDVHQDGTRSQLCRQTGTYNMGNEAQWGQVLRDAQFQWNNPIIGSLWAKIFCAANSTVALSDSEIQDAALGVVRLIPL